MSRNKTAKTEKGAFNQKECIQTKKEVIQTEKKPQKTESEKRAY